MLATTMALSAAALLILMLATWALSLALHDVSIVDVTWGVGSVVVAWIAFANGDGDEGRRALLAGLTTAWGLRLAVYITRRKLREKGEDYRYVEMRERHPERFWLVSLGLVFLLQGALVWVVSLPLQAASAQDDPLGALDVVGVAFWAVGLFFEAVGDAQLARFKADPANRGRVMDRGLWRYTRHPNYFGDFLVWWGIYVIALSTGGAWWTVVSPLVMSVLLLRVSGKDHLERAMKRRRPGYRDYVARTSGFVPLPPRGSRPRPAP
jgi:steroid 5-alpha reductase family enzyme